MTRERHDATTGFLRAEEGAVTVDWVVLTAALVGLGLAVMTVVGSGAETLSTRTSDQMAGTAIRTRFAALSTLLETDFSGGAGGWLGGTVATLAGFGEVLQIGAGGMAEVTLDVPADAGSATISFDMIGGDDLDGEPATVFVNGQAVSVYRDDHGKITVENGAVAGITVEVQQLYRNDPVGAGTHGSDSRATYTITVDDPGGALTLAVASGADQGTANEFYAIDDVRVTSR